jgi:hypothetical protein
MRAIERASDVRSSFVSTTGPTLKIMKAVPLDYLFRGDIMSPSDAAGDVTRSCDLFV